MSLFNESEHVIVKKDADNIPKGQTYTAKFISAGLVGHQEGNYLLTQGVLDNMAYSLKGCPVLVGHQDVLDEDDMEEKAVGYVSNVNRWEDGCWAAEFVIFDQKTIEKIENRELPYVSCAHRSNLSNEGGKLNNVPYKREILDGQMLHLALVKKPRYNGTDIWKNDSEDHFVSEGVEFNKKDNVMFGFKKTKVELDKETLINTSSGEKTIEELVNELEAATAAISDKDSKIAEQDVKIKDLESQVAEAKAAVETKVADPVVTTAAAVTNETDEQLKKDLSNSLSANVETKVVKVPRVTVK